MIYNILIQPQPTLHTASGNCNGSDVDLCWFTWKGNEYGDDIGVDDLESQCPYRPGDIYNGETVIDISLAKSGKWEWCIHTT